MTQEEKQLLLKDLSARLPCGVKVRISSESDVCLQINTVTLANNYASKTECAVVACRGFKAGAEWAFQYK